MIKILLLLAIVVVLGAIFLFVESKTSINASKKGYKYKRKDFFMSRAEHECYDALIVAVGDKYYVFPQVHLPTLIDNKVVGQNWKGAFSHISQKSVDFVLCDKLYISPKLAIELDGIVERIFKDAGLPLLRLENRGRFNPTELLEKINTVLNNADKK